MREYKSVQKWFTYKPYETTTKHTYLEYMAMFCGLLHKTPDELANVSSEEALKLQIDLATVMKEELGLREYSITQRINALHIFWKANGVFLTKDIKKYSGTPWLMRERARENENADEI